jgi:hypothetical protein
MLVILGGMQSRNCGNVPCVIMAFLLRTMTIDLQIAPVVGNREILDIFNVCLYTCPHPGCADTEAGVVS